MNQQTEEIEARLEEERARLRENVEELTERLSPDRLRREAVEAVKSTPRVVTSRIVRFVRENPAPVAIAAIGAYWWWSRRREEREGLDRPTPEEFEAHAAWERYQEASSSLLRQPDEDEDAYQRRLADARADALGLSRRGEEEETGFRERLASAAERTKRFAAACRHKIAQFAQTGAHTVSDAASGTRHAVAGAAGTVGRAATGAASAIGHAASGAAGTVGRAATGAASRVGRAATGAASTIGHAASDVARRSADYYEEHPMTSAGLGVAFGAVIGSLTPLTRLEREQLRGVVDQGLNRGADTLAGAAKAVSAFAQDVGATRH
jgi:ElaB/YqjD/DUF883 family membrane-anchored ribosome-binding protein